VGRRPPREDKLVLELIICFPMFWLGVWMLYLAFRRDKPPKQSVDYDRIDALEKELGIGQSPLTPAQEIHLRLDRAYRTGRDDEDNREYTEADIERLKGLYQKALDYGYEPRRDT
jgi:hypothetical protein